MNNPSFRRALAALSHPTSFSAIIILLLNDHWWRHSAPSWLTGKIGDFAWLIFAPFLLALLLAWIMPRREQLVGYAAIVGTGLIFGLAKTVPAFHALTIAVLEFLTGWPNTLRLDPSDLLAVPALLIAGWIWRRSAAQSIRLPDRGWVLLPLAVLATMANSAGPNFGITCVEQMDNQLLTYAPHDGYYASQDGGLSWTPTNQEMRQGSCERPLTVMVSPANPLVHFRIIVADRQIERSEDGGQTWQTEYMLQELSEAQQVYADRAEDGDLQFGELPYRLAAMDPATGNLIIAADYQGVMVRTPDGQWHMIGVGSFQPIDLRQPDRVVSLLASEGLLALVVFALAAGMMAPGVFSRKAKVMLVLGWLALIGTLSIKMYFLHGNYTVLGDQLTLIGALITGGIAALVAAIRLIAAFRLSPTAAGMTIGLSALAALLFLVPYIMWTQNGILRYVTATLFAGVIVAAMCFAGHRYLRRYTSAAKNLSAV